MTISPNHRRRFLRFLLSRIRRGSIVVAWSDGTVDVFSGPEAGQTAVIIVSDETRLLRGLVEKGSLGFGAAYIDQAWDSPDLPALLEVASRSIDARQNHGLGRTLMALSRKLWDSRPHNFWQSPIEEIGVHYNLGNDFYAAWLDDTMTYSSAIFGAPGETLEDAQHTKYERLCTLLELEPGDRVLEIGSGWGGFAHYAAAHYDVEVTGITLSTEMATYARKRLANTGLAHRTEFRVQDFRAETGTYDKIASIEMIESISADQWPDLFATVNRVLLPGGIVAMQAIAIDDQFYEQLTRREEFIKRYIFPGGDLPTVALLEELAREADLAWVADSSHGADYAETLSRWASSFESSWEDISSRSALLDTRFKRMWGYYLTYCEVGFRTGRLDGVQFSSIRHS